MRETVRSVVKTWELDAVDHFTTAFYYRALSSATVAMLSELGHDPCNPDAPWTSGCWTRFMRELRLGDAYHVTSGLVASDAKSTTLGHKLFNSDTGDLCTSFLQRLSGPPATAALPDPIDWPQREPERKAIVPQTATWKRSSANVVRPEDLDSTGRLDLSALIHVFSDANIQIQNELGMTSSYMRENAIGYSTADYQLAMERPPPGVGTSLEVSTTVAHLGNSSLWFVHEMSDATASAPFARLTQMGVHLDTSARKASALPEPIRQLAQALMG